MVVQWLGLSASTAVGLGSTPGWGTEIQVVWRVQKQTNNKKKNTRNHFWGLPGGPTVKNLCFHCKEHEFDLWELRSHVSHGMAKKKLKIKKCLLKYMGLPITYGLPWCLRG